MIVHALDPAEDFSGQRESKGESHGNYETKYNL